MSKEQQDRPQTLLWGGRFSDAKVDPLMVQFNESINFDKRFWRVDIDGSIAYAKGLAKTGIITQEEATSLVDGLTAVAKEWESNTFVIKDGVDEDIHTANERRLGELIGPVAGKLHTGRSRNDQVATDLRLWMRAEVDGVVALLREFLEVAAERAERAEREKDVVMPGYTHLQRAQPIRWSHWVMSHAWAIKRDVERFLDLRDRFNKCPLGMLSTSPVSSRVNESDGEDESESESDRSTSNNIYIGSGALAGHPFNIDRHFLAESLGFSGPTENSLDSVSDRDHVAEFLFAASLTLTHLSRWAEDLIIYSTSEFGFVTLADAYSTGSSLMPQKKNPDSLELIRGKAGRVLGTLTGFMATLKGLPSTYNKDLQEDKPPLFETADTLRAIVQIASRVLHSLTIHPKKMEGALSADMLATDLADYLVRKGMPFRQAHHVSGALNPEELKTSISQLKVEDFVAINPLFGPDVMQLWNFTQSVEHRSAVGGTSSAAVVAQISQLKSWLQFQKK